MDLSNALTLLFLLSVGFFASLLAFVRAARGRIDAAVLLALLPATYVGVSDSLSSGYSYQIKWGALVAASAILLLGLWYRGGIGEGRPGLRSQLLPFALIAWLLGVSLMASGSQRSILVAGSLTVGLLLAFTVIPMYGKQKELIRQVLAAYVICITPMIFIGLIEILQDPGILLAGRLWVFGNPNAIGMILAPAGPAAILLAFERKELLAKLYLYFMPFAAIIIIWATGSRASILGFGLSTGVFILLAGPRIRTVRVALICLLVAAIGFSLFFTESKLVSVVKRKAVVAGEIKRGRPLETITSMRSLHWESALNVVKGRPFTGYGLGHAYYIHTGVKKGMHRGGHSSYLVWLVETGLVGLFLLLVIYGRALTRGFKAFKNTLAVEEHLAYLACFSILFGQAFHGIFEVQLSTFGCTAGIVIFLLVGIANSLPKKAAVVDEEKTQESIDSLSGSGAVLERAV